MFTLNKNPLHLKKCVIYKTALHDNFLYNLSSNETPAFTFMFHLF